MNAKEDRTGEGLLCGLYGGTDSASESKLRGNSSRMCSSPYVAIVYVASSRLGTRCEVRQCRDTAGRLLEHKVRGGKCVGAVGAVGEVPVAALNSYFLHAISPSMTDIANESHPR